MNTQASSNSSNCHSTSHNVLFLIHAGTPEKPAQKREIEDLKDRYYSVVRRLIKSRAGSDPESIKASDSLVLRHGFNHGVLSQPSHPFINLPVKLPLLKSFYTQSKKRPVVNTLQLSGLEHQHRLRKKHTYIRNSSVSHKLLPNSPHNDITCYACLQVSSPAFQIFAPGMIVLHHSIRIRRSAESKVLSGESSTVQDLEGVQEREGEVQLVGKVWIGQTVQYTGIISSRWVAHPRRDNCYHLHSRLNMVRHDTEFVQGFPTEAGI